MHKPLSLELELIYESVLLYLDSCSSHSKIFPNAGGCDNQPQYFWQMIKIAEAGINDFEELKNGHN